ncbi:hypothetical protein GOP47_0010856 [Adiantum capillus-veneris]|uniref:C2H2-type domain-containing protein n=1 Tax=Adiantum capillus-veneris TaxID=13818 RepID=A0A9D4UVC0_ADICA|nr:hypothetical protein GOP47_0010856 [Adiantum capillus-veneris]
MAEESTHSCTYCDSEHTQLEFALHKISAVHLKKVQRALFQRGFSSICLVCNSSLKDLKLMELHLQEKKHTERMMLMKSFLCSDKCTCVSCGVTFFNEVVLEAHRLLRVHDLEASPPDTPKLNELLKQLSGVCGTRFLSNGSHLCKVCNVKVDGVQESIMHLFSPAHVTRLRSSSCMVCKKDFMHASDRESHLKSGKHSLAMRKCSNFLEEGDTQSLLRKGGYPCMFCMIWCNSWLCLEIHILDTHHNKVSNLRKAIFPPSSRIIFLAGSEGSGASSSCNESEMSKWKEWRGETLEESIWCHQCGVTLVGIDEANQHLNTHGTESCQAWRELHLVNELGLAQIPKIYDCSVCAMSFKSDFMLSVHTACLEHHRRLAAFSSTSTVHCCSSCGILVKNDRDGDDVSICKTLKGSLHIAKDTEAVVKPLKSPSTGCCVVDDFRSLGVTSFLKGTHQNRALVAANETIIDGEAGHIQHDGVLEADESNQGHSKANLLDVCTVPVEWDPKMNQTNTGMIINGGINHVARVNSAYHGGGNHVASVYNGDVNLRHTAKAVANGNNRLAVQMGENAIPVENNFEPEKDSPQTNVWVAAKSHKVQSQPPLELTEFENKVLVPGEMSQEKGTILVNNACLGDLGVPVIVAATLAPLKDLQQSLQSIAAIVTETLSAALPNFYLQQSTSSLKRKSQGNLDNTDDAAQLKRLCGERALEAALQQGLRSVSSNTIKLENVDSRVPTCAEEDVVRHSSTGEDEVKHDLRAVLAVAASVIPSGPPDLSRPASEKDQAVTQPSKQAQESADLRSECLSLGVMGNQAVVERTLPDRLLEETRARAETFHLQTGAALACPDTENQTQSSALSPSAKDSKRDEGSIQAQTPVAPPLKADSHYSKSESNDDDDDDNEDDYSFLDPTKCQDKWWGSESDDSDSM